MRVGVVVVVDLAISHLKLVSLESFINDPCYILSREFRNSKLIGLSCLPTSLMSA